MSAGWIRMFCLPFGREADDAYAAVRARFRPAADKNLLDVPGTGPVKEE